MSALKRMMRVSNRSLIAFIFFFSLSTSCLYFIYVAPGIANTYLFMVQARGIMLRENVKTIGHMIRLYTNKNTTLNGTDYPEGNNSSDYLVQTTTYLPQNFTYLPNLPCPEKLPHMRGSLSVNVSEISFDEVHQLFSKDVEIGPGGHWRPKDCKPRWKFCRRCRLLACLCLHHTLLTRMTTAPCHHHRRNPCLLATVLVPHLS